MVHWVWLVVAFIIGWVARPERKESEHKYIK